MDNSAGPHRPVRAVLAHFSLSQAANAEICARVTAQVTAWVTARVTTWGTAGHGGSRRGSSARAGSRDRRDLDPPAQPAGETGRDRLGRALDRQGLRLSGNLGRAEREADREVGTFGAV
jgi:hypothetical protein